MVKFQEWEMPPVDLCQKFPLEVMRDIALAPPLDLGLIRDENNKSVCCVQKGENTLKVVLKITVQKKTHLVQSYNLLRCRLKSYQKKTSIDGESFAIGHQILVDDKTFEETSQMCYFPPTNKTLAVEH
ncbi:hypothetical protein MAR_014519, partial [Mya arenaria]